MKNRKQTDAEPNTHLTTSDVANFLSVHPNTVRRWNKLGILKAYRIGPRGDRRFRRVDVERLIKGNQD